MDMFHLSQEQHFDAVVRSERVLGAVGGGDYTVACWEPGQCSPYHCHPYATEIYFCFSGGGFMHTPHDEPALVTPGAFVVHPPGELHEYENGRGRTLLFRVRYGTDLSARTVAWRGQDSWQPDAADLEYLREHAHDLSHAAHPPSDLT